MINGTILGLLSLALVLQWAVIMTPTGVKREDSVCPAQTVKVRYPADMADYHDNGHYRIAYCKPTGIAWNRITAGR